MYSALHHPFRVKFVSDVYSRAMKQLSVWQGLSASSGVCCHLAHAASYRLDYLVQPDSVHMLDLMLNQGLLLLQVASIAKYDGKGSIALADSVKSLHVLPCLPGFAAMANQVEGLIQGGPSALSL